MNINHPKYKSIERSKKISESHKGEKSYNWKGGISRLPYTTDWTETLKKSIRERDKYICQLCGKTQIEEIEIIERKLAIHHIDYDKKNNNPNNLITVCNSCHSKTNFEREKWIKFFNQE